MRGFGSPEIHSLKTKMAVAHLECEGKYGLNNSDWLYGCMSIQLHSEAVLKKNNESRGTRLILTEELVLLCQARYFKQLIQNVFVWLKCIKGLLENIPFCNLCKFKYKIPINGKFIF